MVQGRTYTYRCSFRIGAGRGLSLTNHFSETFENVRPYNIGGHRHTPEIEEKLSEQAGAEVVVTFSPHLIPMTRGILSTCYGTLTAGTTAEVVTQAYEESYGDEYFIRLLGQGGYPATKNTRGSNFCDIGWHIDSRAGRVVAVAAIDNLVKGAAGQAVQNLNILFGLDEKTGLMQAPLYP
ncbi:MAG: argC [Firmicutes bacterium]|nr:argC [Bacillota bacterium]